MTHKRSTALLAALIVLTGAAAATASQNTAKPTDGQITVRVVDAKTKKPLTSYQITLVRIEPGRDEELVEMSTVQVKDRKGQTRITPGEASGVVVSASGYLPEVSSFQVLKKGQPLEILLHTGTPVQGKIVGIDKAPLGEVEVSYPLRQLFIARPQPMTERTDAAGEFRLQAPEGETTFTFSKSGFITEKVTVNVPAKPLRVDQTLMTATNISGRVVDDTGAPVAQARVRAMTTTPRSESKDAVTDAEGKFAISALRPVEYKFEASRRSYVTSSTPAKLPASELKLTLPRGATVRGRVTASTGEERAFVVVYIGPETTGINNVEEFGLLGVPTGTLNAYAEYQAMGKLRRTPVKQIQTAPGGEAKVELSFTDQPVLRGKVLEGEKPIERAVVLLRSKTDSKYPQVSFVSDENGSFEAIGIPPGDYSLEVRGRELVSASSHRQEASSTLDIVVKPAPPRQRELATPTPSEPRRL